MSSFGRRAVICVVAPMLTMMMTACGNGRDDLLTGRNEDGDAAKGLTYLRDGDYMGIGVPMKVLAITLSAENDADDLKRYEAKIGPLHHMFHDAHGTWVKSGGCFTCHTASLHGQFQPGLGNPFIDWSRPWDTDFQTVVDKYRLDSSEFRSFMDSWGFRKAVLPKIIAEHAGPNPAFRIEEASSAHRRFDLTYTEKPMYIIVDSLPVPVCDVPPLWNVKKKIRLYYNGQGIGDLRKLLMQAGLVGLRDTVEARRIWEQFRDVAAWIKSLKPPRYPGSIDQERAAIGKDLFERECRKCHGTYGFDGTYPNKIIPLDRIETDPYYATYWKSISQFPDWFNNSWFGQSDPPARLEPQDGYVAPPLDGIWATAPYFHNGSVPNLVGVLDSRRRPELWDRRLDQPAYDSVNIGWQFESVEDPRGASTYDTRKRGYSNRGHTFGDSLTEDERQAILEYLRTL